MAGIVKRIVGSFPKDLTGEAYVKALNEALSPEAIANCKCESDKK